MVIQAVAVYNRVVTGRFSMQTADAARGIVGTVTGEFEIDPRSKSISRWRAFVESEAWGRGQWTPHPPEGRFPLVMAIVETAADDEVARTVPPQAAGCGQRYVDARLSR